MRDANYERREARALLVALRLPSLCRSAPQLSGHFYVWGRIDAARTTMANVVHFLIDDGGGVSYHTAHPFGKIRTEAF